MSSDENVRREGERLPLPTMTYEEIAQGISPEVAGKYSEERLRHHVEWAGSSPERVNRALEIFADVRDTKWIGELCADIPQIREMLLARVKAGVAGEFRYESMVKAERWADIISPEEGTIFADEWKNAGVPGQERPGPIFDTIHELTQLRPDYLSHLATKSTDAARGVRMGLETLVGYGSIISEDIRREAQGYMDALTQEIEKAEAARVV